MNTKAGRTIYSLFASNLFVTAITFHGGTNSITYPWGSNNHRGKIRGVTAEAPDNVALNRLGQSMRESAGKSIETVSLGDSNFSIREYGLGDMTSIVYPVGGGLEDWAYAAGWD